MINVPGMLFIHFIYPLARLEIVTISMCGTWGISIKSRGYIDRVVIRLQVRPPQDFSSMARPALKPLVESDEGSASPPLLDPPSVVAASRLMQEVRGGSSGKKRRERRNVWERRMYPKLNKYSKYTWLYSKSCRYAWIGQVDACLHFSLNETNLCKRGVSYRSLGSRISNILHHHNCNHPLG